MVAAVSSSSQAVRTRAPARQAAPPAAATAQIAKAEAPEAQRQEATKADQAATRTMAKAQETSAMNQLVTKGAQSSSAVGVKGGLQNESAAQSEDANKMSLEAQKLADGLKSIQKTMNDYVFKPLSKFVPSNAEMKAAIEKIDR